MPRRMPVEGVPIALSAQWLLLGLVLEQQSHAYALGQRYKARFGSLVPMPPTSVYRNLDFLAEHGYVKATAIASTPATHRFRTPSVAYEATATGAKVYRQWLTSKVPANRWREEYIARISTGSLLGVQGLGQLVEGYEQNRSTQEGNGLSDCSISMRPINRALWRWPTGWRSASNWRRSTHRAHGSRMLAKNYGSTANSTADQGTRRPTRERGHGICPAMIEEAGER